jgi:2-polyprenyl-3-methyl-5-hydroxy-6-metoxy-1,4-benzoquinol methylase
MDKSHGYEGISTLFIKSRGQAVHGIGASTVRAWVRKLPKNSIFLDLGCGTGIPISKVLMDEGMTVYGVDASPSMVKAFQLNFPNNPVACEAAEESSFFNRQFEAIVAWGLLFLLPLETQKTIIRKSASALQTGGRLLFTSPGKKTKWKDAMTKGLSVSPGAEWYKERLTHSGLLLIEEFEDEGENHYYHSVKI